MTSDIRRMKEIIEQLNQASMVYYQGLGEIMSNYEYDKMYDELVSLEEKTGMVMNNSPTIHVGYETISELPKENHVVPMLSLNKTKEVLELVSWLGTRTGLLSVKLDGISVILTYENGKLVKALTRGNGEVGEVITNNARTFVNIPGKIAYQGTLVLRGEALIRYSDFEVLNKQERIEEKYKNPRNLCSGSVRQLNNEITAKRHIHFYAYTIISAGESPVFIKKEQGMKWLQEQGFEISPYKKVTSENLENKVNEFAEEVKKSDLPSDGLVLTYDDIAYSQALGQTAKYPHDSIAFKWQDELAETILRKIEWSASRTGLINPVAVFDPVELEGTTVTRASVHNVSILQNFALGIGDRISVYKANMIIPQIYENITKSGSCSIPSHCPVCQSETKLQNDNGSVVLVCPNENCYAKKIKLLTHFVSRNAMNIDGLSEATLEKLVNEGMIHSFSDLFDLGQYKEQIMQMEGFGEKSFNKLMSSLENAKDVPLANVLYGLGIKGIGLSMAKLIVNRYPYSLKDMRKLTADDLVGIEGIGEVLAGAFVCWFADKENQKQIEVLSDLLRIEHPKQSASLPLAGMTFVITGSLNHFSGRAECKDKIESLGGKVAGSVSKKTTYLVNNDITSTSSKNKKAKELSIPIIDEERLCRILFDATDENSEI